MVAEVSGPGRDGVEKRIVQFREGSPRATAAGLWCTDTVRSPGGSVTGAGQGSPDRDAEMLRAARRAVAGWAEFPVGADPRPLLLLDGPVRVDKGFATGDAKLAFLRGVVEAAAGVPEDAVRPLRRPAAGTGPRPRGQLRVVAAERSEAEFATDRGHQRLPAWKLEAADALGPIWVLTGEAQAQCWSPSTPASQERVGPRMLKSGTVGAGGRELAVEFTGGSERLFRYDAEVIETPAAVCVVPLPRMTVRLAPGAAITAEGHLRKVRVTLAGRLGGRVLVNLNGTPVPVTSGG
jgi:hypothetical protein